MAMPWRKTATNQFCTLSVQASNAANRSLQHSQPRNPLCPSRRCSSQWRRRCVGVSSPASMAAATLTSTPRAAWPPQLPLPPMAAGTTAAMAAAAGARWAVSAVAVPCCWPPTIKPGSFFKANNTAPDGIYENQLKFPAQGTKPLRSSRQQESIQGPEAAAAPLSSQSDSLALRVAPAQQRARHRLLAQRSPTRNKRQPTAIAPALSLRRIPDTAPTDEIDSAAVVISSGYRSKLATPGRIGPGDLLDGVTAAS